MGFFFGSCLFFGECLCIIGFSGFCGKFGGGVGCCYGNCFWIVFFVLLGFGKVISFGWEGCVESCDFVW